MPQNRFKGKGRRFYITLSEIVGPNSLISMLSPKDQVIRNKICLETVETRGLYLNSEKRSKNRRRVDNT